MTKSTMLIGMTLALSLTPLTAALADGAGVFRTNCVSCHGKNGQGTPGLAPALKGDSFVTGNIDDVMATVKNGRSGDQKHYKNLPIAMPAWGGKLSDADINAVVDYIRGDLQK
ncbi:MAG TPA: cytochrome c [Gammaproteobacteria bacterium]